MNDIDTPAGSKYAKEINIFNIGQRVVELCPNRGCKLNRHPILNKHSNWCSYKEEE